MLRKENMLRKCLVCVMTRDYPSICLNYNFLETTKKRARYAYEDSTKVGADVRDNCHIACGDLKNPY